MGNTCSVANFQAHTCPDASIVGQATAESPLQEQALEGPMALVVNPEGGLPLLGLDLEGALALQLYGRLALLPTPEGAETRVVFNGLPDIPISRFELVLLEDKLNFLGRDLCEPPNPFYNTTFTSHGDVVLSGDTQATVEGCSTVVDPTATLKLKDAASDNPKLIAKVTKGSSGLDEVAVNAPSGVSFGKGKVVVKGDGVRLPKSAVSVARKRIGANGNDLMTIRTKVARGAVRVRKSVDPGDELPFTIDVTDADANSFTLDTPVTARR